MRGALVILGWVVAIMATASGFFIPGPSKVVSGRRTRSSTSQVVRMGRGDTRTTKGKRKRHSYGKCRPRKKKSQGDVGPKPAPVARRWENIEYVESEMAPLKRAMKMASMGETETAAPAAPAEEAVEVPEETLVMPEAEPTIPEAEAVAAPVEEETVKEVAMPVTEATIPDAEAVAAPPVEETVEVAAPDANAAIPEAEAVAPPVIEEAVEEVAVPKAERTIPEAEVVAAPPVE